MCNKLLQTYACGHSKSICTTPCTHALRFAPSSTSQDDSTITPTRANSTASSPSPAAPQSPTHSERPGYANSPLRAAQEPVERVFSTRALALRFKPFSTGPASPTAVSLVSASPTLPTSRSTGIGTAAAPPHLPPRSAAQDPEPLFCSYYIPRNIATSRFPCVECYGREEWEELRESWMESYGLGHPLDRVGDVEGLSGVTGVLRMGRA
ncbi:hypothetical protein C7974DRAFT_444257 [Boeremia exigua]|uniref:uncharacterized protein n=1 Tax=Boeremia exigua TaxID=749465 RepID=UPI001E8E9E41|nr:uncharacterized protein C7974DRAFT_444257 [Boeremia exigua]KAH6614258.1 hypothetical protein C7974DRAFT_444257 [Boeremia exigua]